MRYLCLLLMFAIGSGEIIAQSTGKISYTISNGLQIAGVDGTNPVIYDNDWLDDTPEYTFIWLKAHNGEVNLVGNVNTRDMYGCAAGNCTYTLDNTFREWVDHYGKSVTAMGLRNIPAPVRGSNEALSRPSSGRIEDTRYYVSDGSELILREARKASAAKPLVVVIGGNPTSVANAYLKDPTIIDKIVVLHTSGWRSLGGYNATDDWGSYVVMKKLKYINWDGNLNSWYAGNNINITPEMIASIPSNPLTDMMKQYWANIFARWQDVGDAPVVLYLFNHSLWRNVERRTENNERTTSDTYDFLVISDNDWMNYGSDYINYMKNPANYVVSAATNSPPQVNLTSPAANASYNQGSSITISANASDANGTISKVEFYTGATKLGEDLTSPFSYTWNSATTTLGNHFLTAKATDNQGASTTSGGVSISVVAANANPTVSITSPGNNASYTAGATVTITAAASDNGGSISKVEFFNGTTKLGEVLTSPYSFTWTNVPAGTFSLTAKATDNQGAATTSSAVTISAAAVATVNAAPVVNISSPANNASFTAGATVTITVAASDNGGSISKVEFFNGTAKLGEVLTSPYSFTWTNVPAGTFSLTAKATDNQGATTTSAAVTISAAAVATVNAAPLVSITSPAKNASFNQGSSITISANATDANGTISKVEFYTGETKLGEDLTSPYSYTWNSATTNLGNHFLTAKATDNEGASTTSEGVLISVTNTPPVVNLTSPTNNANYTSGAAISIAATASDTNGSIVKVEFFNGTSKLGEDVTSPFSTTWTNAPAGTHTLTAKATDNQNLSTTSAPVAVTVAAQPGAPLVSLTSPTNNASFQPETAITLSATASQTNGSITKVEFFNGSTMVGEDLTAPYSIEWTNAPAGTHSLSAKATDTNNLTATSAVTVITVIAPNVPPVVNIVTPGNKAVVSANTSISITADATAPNGSVTKVEFYNGSVKLGEDITSPYNHEWATNSPGVYVIVAKATDNNGLTAAHQIQLTVNPANRPPFASAGDDITIHLPAEETLIRGIGTDPEEGILNYSWTQVSGPNAASLGKGTLGELLVSNLVEGTYVFELSVTDNGDVTTRDRMVLIVLPPDTLLGQVPRYFTPNNDGMNDFWEWPDIELYENALLTIFNRVGQKVYETTSYQNNWNGNVDGRPLQSDAYYYIIRLGNTALKGAVRIIR